MAYKEVSRVEITEVIRQWQAGRGIREITPYKRTRAANYPQFDGDVRVIYSR